MLKFLPLSTSSLYIFGAKVLLGDPLELDPTRPPTLPCNKLAVSPIERQF
jgi:hypothetical protein